MYAKMHGALVGRGRGLWGFALARILSGGLDADEMTASMVL
jgi:hypothetical protein